MPRPPGSQTMETVSAPTGANQRRAHGKTRSEDVSPEGATPLDQTRDSTTRLARLGPSNGRWNGGERITHHGYVMIFVGVEHPLADVKGYAYLHLLVWAAAGRPLPGPDEELHHQDDRKTYNRLNNLEVITTAEHARRHAATKPRDGRGRFAGTPATREAVTPCAG